MRKNRDFLIDYPTQIRIISRLLSIALIFAILMCAISYKWILNLRPIFDEAIAGPLKPQEAFQVIANLLLYRLIGIMILMVILFVVVGVVLTHRFTGPIWKLQRDIESFLNGEKISPITFRKSDEFQKLPPLVNKLMDKIKS
jgi:methyl-accepting chemotaxis protein